MTQPQLAEATKYDVSVRTIQSLEAGEKCHSYYTFNAIAKVFDVSIEEITLPSDDVIEPFSNSTKREKVIIRLDMAFEKFDQCIDLSLLMQRLSEIFPNTPLVQIKVMDGSVVIVIEMPNKLAQRLVSHGIKSPPSPLRADDLSEYLSKPRPAPTERDRLTALIRSIEDITIADKDRVFS